MSRAELGVRWGGTLRRGGVRRRKHFGRDTSRPLTVEKGVFTPWPPLRGGSARRRWGRELCGCPKYFGFRLSKNVFLPCCVCRGDHWSPASLPQQRIFRDGFLQGKWARASNARPYKSVSTSVAAPHFRCPLCRTGVYFSLLTKAVSLCYLVIG